MSKGTDQKKAAKKPKSKEKVKKEKKEY